MSGSAQEPLSETTFREMYPEFKDTTAYSSYMVNLFLDIGNEQLDPLRWGKLYFLGVGLFTAHNLVIAKRNGRSSQNAGSGVGLVSGKTLGKASIDYDTANTAIKDGGPWNLTTYGTQFLWYAQMVGSGGWQSTGPYLGPTYPQQVQAGWPWVGGGI